MSEATIVLNSTDLYKKVTWYFTLAVNRVNCKWSIRSLTGTAARFPWGYFNEIFSCVQNASLFCKFYAGGDFEAYEISLKISIPER